MILASGFEVDDDYWNGLIAYLRAYGLNVVEDIPMNPTKKSYRNFPNKRKSKMHEKMKEIEERWSEIEVQLSNNNSLYIQLGDDAYEDIKYLLSHIKELEKSNATFRKVIKKLTLDNHGMVPNWLLDLAPLSTAEEDK